MVDHEPALVRLDRDRAGADLRRLPAPGPRPHDVAVAAPVDQVGALGEEDVAERRVAVVARPAQHQVAPADPAWEQDAVAVEREVGVVELVESHEVVRRRDSDRRAVVAVAPGHVVPVLEPRHARVVGVLERLLDLGNPRIRRHEDDRLLLDLPVDAVGAPARVEVHRARGVVDAEDAREAVSERDDSRVEDAVRARQVVARDDRVPARAPERGTAPRWSVLPRNRVLAPSREAGCRLAHLRHPGDPVRCHRRCVRSSGRAGGGNVEVSSTAGPRVVTSPRHRGSRPRGRRALRWRGAGAARRSPGELVERPAPVDAAERFRHGHRLVGAAEGRELDRGVEVLPARDEQRPVVAVELDSALLAVLGDVEARRQPHERPVRELDQRDPEVGCAHRERLARRGDAIGVHDLPVSRDSPGRAEDGGEVGEGVDADVRHRPDRVERRRPRMPGLDPAPVDLGVDDAHVPDRAGVEQAPGGLLGIAQERDRRAGKPQPFASASSTSARASA